MKKTICLICISLLNDLCFSQSPPWYLTRGLSTDEVAWGVDVDSAGNVYWAVEEKNQWPYWYYNIVLFKIDSNAQELWQSVPFGWTYNEIAFVVKVKGQNVYLAGRQDSTGSPTIGDPLALCYNTGNGNLNWSYNYNPTPDSGYEEIDGISIQTDGIYSTGWIQKQNDQYDILIHKTDLNGQFLWTNSWNDTTGNSNGKKIDGANGQMVMDKNFIYVAAHLNRITLNPIDLNSLYSDGALVCFNRSDGAYQWHQIWGGVYYDDALGLTMSSDSMIYVVGITGSFGNGSQTWLNKYSRTGQLYWSRTWGGTGTEDSRALITDGDSMIYVVGATSSYGNGAKDIFILKFDSAGTLIDSLFWGGVYDEVAHDVVMHDSYLYITGQTGSFGNGQINGDHKADGLLLKVNGRTMLAPDTTVTNISENENSVEKIAVYPNPTKGDLQFTMQNMQFKNRVPMVIGVKIFDIFGQEVLQSFILNSLAKSGTASDGKHFIHLDLPDGMYCMKIFSDDFSVTKKIVIIQ